MSEKLHKGFPETFPSLTIVTPTLNSERTLTNMLSSASLQRYPKKVELLIVDGGSKDKTIDIARNYGARIIVDKCYGGAQAAMAIGLREAEGKLVAFIDSDNILPSRDWLMQMVKPFILEKECNIVGAQPLWYHYDKNLSSVDRYYALIGVDDPLAYYSGRRDRLLQTEDEWTLLGEILKDTKDYIIIRFNRYSFPTIGCNGFVVNREIVLKSGCDPESFFHTDILFDLLNLGYNTYAMVKTDITHKHADSITNYTRKKIRRARDYAVTKNLRRYSLYSQSNKLKLLKAILFVSTIVQPAYMATKNYRKLNDKAWFFHPVLCPIIGLSYVVTLPAYSLVSKAKS
jgi:glycosyltransferase involved in cell wall biosynthesis